MPTPDPGYQHFLKQQEFVPDIVATEHSYIWTSRGEVHEFYPEFGTVHITSTKKEVYG